MQLITGMIFAGPLSGTFVMDLQGSQDESNRPLVLKRGDTETAYPVLQALGTVEVGHRNSTWSGIVGPFGRVTSGSNHTHLEHVLLNAPGHRQRFQESAVDVGGDTVVVGTFLPADLPDPTHQFFSDKETVYRFRKSGIEGVKSITIGPGVEEKAGATRVGWGKNFIEFRKDGVLLYLEGKPCEIVQVTTQGQVQVRPVELAAASKLSTALKIDPAEERKA